MSVLILRQVACLRVDALAELHTFLLGVLACRTALAIRDLDEALAVGVLASGTLGAVIWTHSLACGTVSTVRT